MSWQYACIIQRTMQSDVSDVSYYFLSCFFGLQSLQYREQRWYMSNLPGMLEFVLMCSLELHIA